MDRSNRQIHTAHNEMGNGSNESIRRHQPSPYQWHSQSQRNMTRNTKPSDSSCFSIKFIRYILHTFNLMFLMSGVAVTTVAIWTIGWKHDFVALLDTKIFVIISYILLSAGLLSIATVFLGCYGIRSDKKSAICFYALLLIVIFVLEFLVGSVTYVYEMQIDDELLQTLNKTYVTSYGIDVERTNAIDIMQQKYKCCGAERFEDWQYSVWITSTEPYFLRPKEDRIVPDSCCITFRNGCGKSDHPSNIAYTGCIYRFIDELRDHINILGAIGFGFCFIQLFGFLLSCCLYCK